MRFFRKKIKLLVIFFIILIVLSLNFWQDGVKNFFYSVSESISQRLWNEGDDSSDLMEGILERGDLKTENEELKKLNQELLARVAFLAKTEEENRMLREALGLELQKDFQLVLADILSKDVAGDSILINKGLEDGLAVEMPVINEQKVLLGQISEVYQNYCRVMLVSDPESSFPAEIQEKGEITGVIKGKGNFRILLEKILHDKEVNEGDVVITSSLGGIFPRGLLIGKVSKVQKSDIESFQKIEIAPLFDIEELRSIFIITNS